MKISVKGLNSNKQKAMQILSEKGFLEISESGVSLAYDNKGCSVEKQSNGYHINGTTAYFFRVLGYLIADVDIPNETPHFKHLSAMIDTSRNAVMKVEAIKDFICDMALAGYDQLMLYIEDTLCLETDPYFGYMRGRYSKKEIKDIEAFASIFGIEVIPCIQTLGHLNQMLRWPAYRSIVDIKDILLVGADETYAFLDRLFHAVSETFTSKQINIGMDEAYLLGRGVYATNYGLKDKETIMVEHLSRVLELVKKYGFKPMMWSDMFFKMGFHDYDTNIKLPKQIIDKVDPSLTLVYWDYASLDKAHYDVRFKLHKQFHNDIAFAGGAWTWFGFVPHISFASKACQASINSAKAFHIKTYTLTFWGDNGGECPPYASLSVLRRAASYAYDMEDEQIINQTFEGIYHIKADLVDDLELPDIISDSHKDRLVNPSKYLLYQDIFKGIFDRSITPRINKRYQQYEKRLLQGIEHPRFGYLFKVLSSLSHVLSLKADLGNLTRERYHQKDYEALQQLIHDRYEPLIEALEIFYHHHQQRWMKDNKPHGFDVQDLRLGGLIQRVKHQKDMIESYVNHDIDIIEELEEDVLPFNGFDSDGYYFNAHQLTVTTNVV